MSFSHSKTTDTTPKTIFFFLYIGTLFALAIGVACSIGAPTQSPTAVSVGPPTQVNSDTSSSTENTFDSETVPTSLPTQQDPTPTQKEVIAPPPLDTAKILWTDNFASGISESWSIVTGDWRTSNGYLVPSNEDDNSIIVGGDPSWANYTIDVLVEKFSESYYSGGILVRIQDSNNFMRVRVFDSVFQHGSYWEIIRNGNAEIIPGTEIDARTWPTPLQLRVVVDGANYQFFINGELQSSFSDTTFKEGYIGFQSFGNLIFSDPHLAGFGEFKVTEIRK